MAGPSRLGSIAIVTVLSCVVLGAVWSLVLYTLPQNDLASEPTPVSFPPQPATPASPAHTGVPAPPTPEPVSQPVVVREPAPVIQIEAQEHPPVEPVRAPFGRELKCDLEIEALCPEEEGERRACLLRKTAQLSAPCRPMLRERLVRMKEAMQQLRTACEADRRQFCREVPLGGGALVQCLESHAQEVSDQCFQLLPKRGRLLN
ncbi:MAG: hypothetical protein WAT82_03715 [Nitrospira sp.]|nr:hypothetical protein [Nitrospira sp.]MBK7487155.1 hypothetical protein [Nitrospira sp.]MBP6200795.1 hypothetical protein [Nitrospira sp.]MBP6207771.1 hypothetical protein [Nitrospira sp.]HRC25646.1 hypothetical protein [Nitrospira sp.]